MHTQMLEKAGKLPDAGIACVGGSSDGGSNTIGAFHPFVKDKSVEIAQSRSCRSWNFMVSFLVKEVS